MIDVDDLRPEWNWVDGFLMMDDGEECLERWEVR